MTVYPSFLDQFLDDYHQSSPSSIPQIHSPDKPVDVQFCWPPQPNNNKIGNNNFGYNQIPAPTVNNPLNQASNSNVSLNSMLPSPSSSSSCHQFYDPNDTFSDLFPSLPDQEENWQDFGSLLGGIDEKGTTVSSVGAGTSTTKAMWYEKIGGVEQQQQRGIKEMDVEEEPIALRTRSHLPKSEEQIMLQQKSAEKAISFWQQEQIQQWIESVDVEMKKKKLSSKRRSKTLMAHKNTKKLSNSRRDCSHRRKIRKEQRIEKNGVEFGKSGVASNSNDEQMEDGNGQQKKQKVEDGKSILEEENVPKVYYCICQRPDDQFSFYVGCDGCNGWFHAECVGTTQEKICAMDGPYFCPKCTKAGKGNL